MFQLAGIGAAVVLLEELLDASNSFEIISKVSEVLGAVLVCITCNLAEIDETSISDEVMWTSKNFHVTLGQLVWALLATQSSC